MSEAPENVRLIGGEMLLWSDASCATDWGDAALELVRRLLPAGGRVLLAGPHPPALVDEVAAHAATVATLLRSYPDACALAERLPRLEVYCGDLAAFTAGAAYDLVLALDGLQRTHSAEAPAPSWRGALAVLAGAVAPGGRLVLAVRNDLGVDRFVEARPGDREGSDAQWAPHGFDPTYPNGVGALGGELESAGLAVEWRYSAYPGHEAPRALLAREALDLPEALMVPLSGCGGDQVLVADPLHLTRLAFSHGLGEDLAPLWLTVASRPPADGARGAGDGQRLPLGLVEDGTVVREIARAGEEWVTRRLPDGAAQPVPAGRLVEEVLVEACVREDVRAVRELLAGVAAWVEAGGDVTAAADSLVWDGERFEAVTPGPAPAEIPSERAVFSRIAWRFAVRLLAAGHHHPWPWPQDPVRLALTLCDMAGRPCDQADLDRGRKLDAELGRPAELGQAAPTYRDLIGARERLADQLTAALARVARLETRLTYRERELTKARAKLKRARQRATAYRRTLGSQLSRRLTRRLARPRAVARKVLRRLSG
ncbi:hypothetical protein ABZ297_20480 [Nonomuraea sp. NPDC005983]|uniref:hypothetical protein n=1 Tax=Nonomuraea sp. NPDC005983 TaxID=3155595 RepID=UPI0033BBE6E5